MLKERKGYTTLPRVAARWYILRDAGPGSEEIPEEYRRCKYLCNKRSWGECGGQMPGLEMKGRKETPEKVKHQYQSGVQTRSLDYMQHYRKSNNDEIIGIGRPNNRSQELRNGPNPIPYDNKT